MNKNEGGSIMDKINEFLKNNYQGYELPGLGEMP